MKHIVIIFFLFFISGCAQVASINLKKHEFGKKPSKIVWLQIAGLTDEHLALIKFKKLDSKDKTNFENALCLGKMWDYDIYRLRPNAKLAFLSEVTGRKSIQNTCDDYVNKPIWNYLNSPENKTGIFEIEGGGSSIDEANKCHQDFLKNAVLWKMEKGKTGELTFHQNEKNIYQSGNTYYDRSCSKGDCFTPLSSNIISTFEEFTKNKSSYIFNIRDFSFFKALKNKKIKLAESILLELDKVLAYFRSSLLTNSDLLLLVTTSDPLGIEFPEEGKAWGEYVKTGNNILYKKTSLVSSVYSFGARAENFCGIFEKSEILERIFSGPGDQGLELKIINPFN